MAIFKIIAISELEQELQNIEGLKIVKKEYKTDNPSYNMIDPDVAELVISFIVSVSGSIAANLLWAGLKRIIVKTHRPITLQTTSEQIIIDEDSQKEEFLSSIKADGL